MKKAQGKRTIYFRADAGAAIGHGHVTRCSALAECLKGAYETVLLSQPLEPPILASIEGSFSRKVELPRSERLDTEEAEAVARLAGGSAIVVLDHYRADARYQGILRRSAFALICVDDMHDRRLDADIVLNQTPGVSPSDYGCAPGARLLLGTRYLMLRRPFREAAARPVARKPIDSCFINLGGSDPANFTRKAIEAASRCPRLARIDVVVGSSYAPWDELRVFVQADPSLASRVRLHRGLGGSEICALMERSPVAICSASGVSLEYAAIGGGLLFLTTTVSNQAYVSRYLLDEGLALPFERLADTLASPGLEDLRCSTAIRQRGALPVPAETDWQRVFAEIEQNHGERER